MLLTSLLKCQRTSPYPVPQVEQGTTDQLTRLVLTKCFDKLHICMHCFQYTQVRN